MAGKVPLLVSSLRVCRIFLMCVSSLLQNGRTPCDADIERLTLNEGYINGSHHVSIFGALTVSVVKFLTKLTLIISLELRIF